MPDVAADGLEGEAELRLCGHGAERRAIEGAAGPEDS